MLSVTVKVSGTPQEIARLQRLGDKLNDFSSAFTKLGTEMKTYYSSSVFASGGGLTGKKWQALSPSYKKWKGRHYPNKGVLIASGKMQHSFRASSDRSSLTIDNTDPKFKYHQLGTGFAGAQLSQIMVGRSIIGVGGGGPGRGNNLPARPMLVINGDIKEMVGTVIDEDIKKKIASVS